MRAGTPTILFACTEDWFFYSHFRPLIRAARMISEDVRIVLVTNTSEKKLALEQMGIEIIPFDFSRASLSAVSMTKIVWKLYNIMRSIRPNIVHSIALKPIVAAGLAAQMARVPVVVHHLTGQGFMGLSDAWRYRVLRESILHFLSIQLAKGRAWVLVENPDDKNMLIRKKSIPQERCVILGGAGIDPEQFTPQPLPENDPPVAAFVGRMIWSKGVDILIKAIRVLEERGVQLKLELYGAPDPANPRVISQHQLEDWARHPLISWKGATDDILSVWRRADIAVIPSRGGEGMPRAMLEAAACARPLVVTDVPGCRHFVRDGVEGFVVPTEDPEALANALAQLAKNRSLRERMGKAARERVLMGYTEEDIVNIIYKIYENNYKITMT